MASICNAEWRRYGGTSGRAGFVHSFSGLQRRALTALLAGWPLALAAAPPGTAPLTAPQAAAQAAPPTAPQPAPPAAWTALPPALHGLMERAGLPDDALALQVTEIGAATPTWQWNAARPMPPASLMKLATTYAGLALLGPGYTWTTPVWIEGRRRKDDPQVIEGNIHLQGRGDPTLVMERVWLMLQQLRQLGVREIRGDLVLDRSPLAEDGVSPAAFDQDPDRPYNARPDALLLNFKVLTLVLRPDPARGVAWVGLEPALDGVSVPASVPLSTGGVCGDWRIALGLDLRPDALRLSGHFPAACGEKRWARAYPAPERYAARLLAQAWRDGGGVLRGQVREGPAPTSRPPDFVFPSRPLADVIRDINRYSNNVMAEQLFLTLALEREGRGTPEAARALLGRFVQEQGGCAEDEARIDNGSGLSREARLSARCLSGLLQAAWRSPRMPELLASLPGAEDGSTHLKTGTLDEALGRAGLIQDRQGRRHLFVAMIHHPRAAALGRPVLDHLVEQVREGLTAPSPPPEAAATPRR